jgi:hypothetical protein
VNEKRIKTTTLTPPDQLVWATRDAFTAPMSAAACAEALAARTTTGTLDAATLKIQLTPQEDGYTFALIRHLRVGDVWCVGTLTSTTENETHVTAASGIDGALVIFIVFVNLLLGLWLYLAGAALPWYGLFLVVMIGLPTVAIWRDKQYLIGILRGQLT